MPGGSAVESEQVVWLEGLRAGDHTTFEAVFDAYRPPLWSFLVRLTDGQVELAEDLLQETFLRLARCARRLRGQSNLSGWLFTVAHNLWRSHRRWRRLDQGTVVDGWERPSPRGPDDAHALRVIVEQLDRALAELSPRLREVAELVIAEEWTPAEVAEHLCLPPDTVRQRLTRARRQIHADRAFCQS